jgi:hypothetical protein
VDGMTWIASAKHAQSCSFQSHSMLRNVQLTTGPCLLLELWLLQ